MAVLHLTTLLPGSFSGYWSKAIPFSFYPDFLEETPCMFDKTHMSAYPVLAPVLYGASEETN